MSRADLARLADEIESAHRSRVARSPITDEFALTMPDAYRIQALLLDRRAVRGERLAGWKIGYTSAAMRRQMNVDAPNFGPLTDAMLLGSGATIPPDSLIQPRVEPEIVVRLADRLAPGATAHDVAAALDMAAAGLEVVDSAWRDYRFRIEDNTADGSSAAHAVCGPAIAPGTDLGRLAVELSLDGVPVASGLGSAAMGDPLAAVAWLAGELARHGRTLEPGQIVLTGGLTASVPLAPGSTVTARFGTEAAAYPVSVHRAA